VALLNRTTDPQDRERLLAALAEAETAIGVSEPNPRVGCLIGHASGPVLGRGATQAVGGPHAEIMALRDAQANGHSVVGATAWVTLEPCAHHGRTPPCCDALVAAGIARVVIGGRDPNPKVDGAGAGRLQAAGVQVAWAPEDIELACRELNPGFFQRHESGRPWVRMKAALTADGRVARPDGSSQWITGPAAREDGHRWRLRADAVITGVGTVLADDPLMTVRLPEARRQPLRVVLDTRWRTPPTARLLASGPPVLIVGCEPLDTAPARRLADAGALLVRVEADARGHVDLQAVLQLLASREVNELHVEAGPQLNGAWLEGDWVDELLLYLAPRLLGSGLPPAVLATGEPLAEAPLWRWHTLSPVGDDLRLTARRSTAHSRGVEAAYTAPAPVRSITPSPGLGSSKTNAESKAWPNTPVDGTDPACKGAS
jgi:diaminohydroxyphosphoribosylaminopyrimidine deaminase/5-amino-6-(5-phosphoribosylamino)uracil reductase